MRHKNRCGTDCDNWGCLGGKNLTKSGKIEFDFEGRSRQNKEEDKEMKGLKTRRGRSIVKVKKVENRRRKDEETENARRRKPRRDTIRASRSSFERISGSGHKEDWGLGRGGGDEKFHDKRRCVEKACQHGEPGQIRGSVAGRPSRSCPTTSRCAKKVRRRCMISRGASPGFRQRSRRWQIHDDGLCKNHKGNTQFATLICVELCSCMWKSSSTRHRSPTVLLA